MELEVAGINCCVPDYFQQVGSMPDDPEGSIAFMAQSDMAMCFVLVYPVPEEYAMPFDERSVVEDIHGALGDSQGLVEAKAGEVVDRRYIYSIVRSLKEEDGAPAGVRYVLCLDVADGLGGVARLRRFFDEIGTTGICLA